MPEMIDLLPSNLKNRLEEFGVNCPQCGAPLVRLNGFARDTGRKFSGVCFNCKYMEPSEQSEIRAKKGLDLTLESLKNSCYQYLYTYSILSESNVFNNTFKNFEVKNANERRVFELAKKIAGKMQFENVHSALIGKTGRGKTHLAVAMMYKYLIRSNFSKTVVVTNGTEKVKRNKSLKVIFFDFPELLYKLKSGIGRKDISEKVNDQIEESKRCDLLILDDVGAERDSDYAIETLETIVRARENKRVIFTSNLTGKELSERYGAKLMSRLAQGGAGNSIAFDGIADHRG